MGRKDNSLAEAMNAAHAANIPAFVLESGEEIPHSILSRQVALVSEALHDVGIGSSDRVVLASPRNYLGITGFLGVASTGICCPVNPKISEAEYATIFRSLGIAAVVATDESANCISVARSMDLPVLQIATARLFDVDVSGPKVTRPMPEGGSRHALLMQTSGTTSQPKIVLLTHENILAAAKGIVSAFEIAPGDLCLNPMPLHHVHGLLSAGMASLLGSSTVCCLPNFDPKSFAAAYNRLQPTWFTGSPAMHIALLEHFKRSAIELKNSRLRFLRSSSAPLPATVINDLEEVFQAPLIETYGLTETASMITTNPLPPGERKIGSVGKPNVGELQIITDESAVAGVGVEGEIVLRGPSVITQYAEIGDKNQDYFIRGWLRTGDLGKLDTDGYCYITGRKKELIKRGGLSVYPSEVDNLLIGDHRVAEAITFSVPHPTLGEEVVAAVVAAKNVDVNDEELRTDLLAKLPAYKVPARILVLKQIPKSETGKVLRRSMAEQLAHLLAPENVLATNELEQQLLDCWRDVLSRNDIGVTDNVFLFGADPTRSRLVAEMIKDHWNLPDITPGEMFRAPTVSQQATILSSRLGASLVRR